jgi:hypothetical protein
VVDISNYWTGENPGTQNNTAFLGVAGPGSWNDADMLIIGDFSLSYGQQRAQLALWSIFASPLLVSSDLRSIDSRSADILRSAEVIGVNQVRCDAHHDLGADEGPRDHQTYDDR